VPVDPLIGWVLVAALLVGLRVAPVFALAPPFTLTRVPPLFRMLLGLGTASLSVADLMELKVGSVVELDNRLNDLVDLKLNGAVVARGELVAVEDHFAVRIVEIVPAP
jgi:flagellar motor switch protein FliN